MAVVDGFDLSTPDGRAAAQAAYPRATVSGDRISWPFNNEWADESGHHFTTPGGQRGGGQASPGGVQAGSGLSDFYLNYGEPTGGFYKFLNDSGITSQQTSPYATFARAQQGQQYASYLGQAADNPNLGFYDYLKQNFNPQALWGQLSPQQQGINTAITQPRARWVF